MPVGIGNMENAGVAHGAIASTGRMGLISVDEYLTQLTEQELRSIRQNKPQMERVTQMRYTDKPPTFVPDGMIYEDRRGNTRAVWTDKAKSAGAPSYFKAWMFFLAALAILTTIDVTIPASVLVAPVALFIWVALRRAIPNPVHRANKPVPYREPVQGGPYMETYDRSGSDAYGRRTRIGDHERGLVLTELGIHFAAGRLDMETHDARQNEALSAVYSDALRDTLRELPHLTDKERRVR